MADYGEMFYGTLPQDTQDMDAVLRGVGRSLRDIGRGVSYYPYDLIGAPVDLINMALTPVGLGSEEPVMGSDYLRNIARSLGLAEAPTGSGTETATRFASGLVNPASGARAVGRASDLVTRGANISADKLVQMITQNPEATAPAVLEAAGQMLPLPRITTYHGSPYLFRELDPAMVGTGEGAQAYGYGAGYTAQVRDVAESYTPRDYEYEDQLMKLYKQAERRQDYGSMEVLESAMMHKRPAELREQFGEEAEDIINSIAGLENRSYLYKGEIPDEILPKFLDWDIEISQQSKEVQDLAKKLGLEPTDLGGDLVAKVGKDAAGTKVMEEAGIKGIKYYDGNSRNAQFGSQNFIPFSPEDYQIEEINDIPLSEYLNQGLL